MTTDQSNALRVVLADDHELILQGIASILSMIDGVEVVDQCCDLPSLMDSVAEHEPDVVITDIRMPPTNTDEGIVAARAFRSQDPSIGVVVLSQFAEPEYVIDLFADGSDGLGYLLKEKVDLAELERSIRSVASGGSAVDSAIVDLLVKARMGEASKISRLTPREQDVLGLIAKGLSNTAVSNELVISQKAVAKHINSIFSKLDLAGDGPTQPRVKAVLLWLSSW